jgi:hypothetical protein
MTENNPPVARTEDQRRRAGERARNQSRRQSSLESENPSSDFVRQIAAASGLLVMDARVEPGTKHVDQKIHEDKRKRDQQDQGLGHRIVAIGDRLDEQHADAVQIKVR